MHHVVDQLTSAPAYAARTTYDAIFLTMLLMLLSAPTAHAAGGDPVPVPTRGRSRTPSFTAESRYNEGLVFAQHRDWPRAEAAYRDAIRMKAEFPEAWNGLGHALKGEKKFDESIRAYHEALRLRPNYAQALEYLGEAYVAMGKMDEARAILQRLEPLDAHYAEDLARVLAGGTASW